MDQCIFCQIIRGEIPSFKVWENETHLAFLSISPIKSGHTLVIPKKHTDYIFDLSDQDLAELIVASKPVAEKLKQVFHPATGKIGIMVAGMEVPHVHIHLIPLDTESELNFANQKKSTPSELEKVLDKINAV